MKLRLIAPFLIILLLPTGQILAADSAHPFPLFPWFLELAAQPGFNLSLLVAIAAFTLISEDLACIGAGLLAAKGVISTTGAILAAGLGIYIGDLLLYWAGYLIGISALNKAPLCFILSKQLVLQSQRLFAQRGFVLVFASRFLPGTRTAIFFAAGLVKANPGKIALVFVAAVIIWTPLLVLGAQFLGEQMISYLDFYAKNALWYFLAIIFSLFIFKKILIPLVSWRGRRLLVGRIGRILHWEFWPYYIINLPIFLYVLYLGIIRFRQPTLFTLANPVITPDGGFIGEKKSKIMAALPQTSLGAWRLIDGKASLKEKLKALRSFLEEMKLDFPIVLKPDVGQRGQGVEICENLAQAKRWLESTREDCLAMEYLPGREFGVFYYRYPRAAKGKILGVTVKVQPQLTGDGRATLEELILRDKRAVRMAPTYFKTLQNRLYEIPEADEKITLVEVGAHALGTIFLDGKELNTPQLLASIEKILLSYEGFYFGRFDLKAKTADDLKMGKNLKIIELNGVTSEATFIYDPRYRFLAACKVLLKQWEIAFAIGKENQEQGLKPMALVFFLRHWRRGGR